MSESAGMKLHNSTDLLFRENVVRHIRHAHGWPDTINWNNRITRNIFADIPGEINPQAVHIEASAKTNEIEDNAREFKLAVERRLVSGSLPDCAQKTWDCRYLNKSP